MQHGKISPERVDIPENEYDSDPHMWAGLYMSMSDYLLLEKLEEESNDSD